MARLRREYALTRKAELFALFQESLSAEQEAQLRAFEDEALPASTAVIQREWKSFRSSLKPMNPFLQVPFKDWLFKREATLTDDAILTWAAHHSIIRV